MLRISLGLIMFFTTSYVIADTAIITTPINPSAPSTTAPHATFPGTTPKSNHPLNPADPPLPRSLPNTPVSIENPPNDTNPPNMQNRNSPPLPEPNAPTNPNVFSPANPGIGVSPKTEEDTNSTSSTPNNGVNINPPAPIEPTQD